MNFEDGEGAAAPRQLALRTAEVLLLIVIVIRIPALILLVDM